MSKFNFCTFFDKNYLFKGLALYYSLCNHCPQFDLWVVCFDDLTYSILKKMRIDNIHLVPLREFEDKELLRVKNFRTKTEYYWTCTPSVPFYILNRNPQLKEIFYIDADMFFWGSPEPVHEEFNSNSILIIEHRFLNKDKKVFLEASNNLGIYNVGLIGFRNDKIGLECLQWWRDHCIEWCYYRKEGNKFGDQKYLDDWPERFPKVVILQHKGVCVAPWNINNYKITNKKGKIILDGQELILYHFHAFQECDWFVFDWGIGNYPLYKKNVRFIYTSYVRAIKQAMKEVRQIIPDFQFPGSEKWTSWRKWVVNMPLYPFFGPFFLRIFEILKGIKRLVKRVF